MCQAMKGILKEHWRIIMGVILITMSAVLYTMHFFVFRDAHHIFIYLLGDIAFIPVEVLFVTLIVHHLITEKEKRSLRQKLNMLVGAFFSEAGTVLLKRFSGTDPDVKELVDNLKVTDEWVDENFKRKMDFLKRHRYAACMDKSELKDLKTFLAGKMNFLLSLLANPNLLEHEEFTDLLWAVFHLTEELEKREGFENISDTDYDHLTGDINRAYRALTVQWLEYMDHLKLEYPYLFSLAMRTNPFNLEASVEIRA